MKWVNTRSYEAEDPKIHPAEDLSFSPLIKGRLCGVNPPVSDDMAN